MGGGVGAEVPVTVGLGVELPGDCCPATMGPDPVSGVCTGPVCPEDCPEPAGLMTFSPVLISLNTPDFGS